MLLVITLWFQFHMIEYELSFIKIMFGRTVCIMMCVRFVINIREDQGPSAFEL